MMGCFGINNSNRMGRGSSSDIKMPSSLGATVKLLKNELESAEIEGVSGFDKIVAPASMQTKEEDLEFIMNEKNRDNEKNEIAKVMKDDLDFSKNVPVIIRRRISLNSFQYALKELGIK